MADGKSSSETAGKPIRCKAAICREAGEPLVIEEIMVAPPSPYEVRIRIICTSLCHSDVTFWKLKDPPACFPRILGHEAVGVVESVGENVNEVAAGDVVIPVSCRNVVSVTIAVRNTAICVQNSHSGFSEYTVVDVSNVVKIDPSIPPNRACLFGCCVATGVGAACKTAKVVAGSTVAIFGLGSIGLAVAKGAKLCGAARIIGVDVNPDKFEVAKIFGVTEFINSKECGDKSLSQVYFFLFLCLYNIFFGWFQPAFDGAELCYEAYGLFQFRFSSGRIRSGSGLVQVYENLVQLVIEMTGGGADYCFECVGISSLVEEAFASCRKGWGKTVVLGVDKPGAELKLSSSEVLVSGKTLTGCLYGGLKTKTDVPLLIKRYTDKELTVDEFVTHEVKFEDINRAFELLLGGKCIRCLIWMDK
ncbi:Alcohol dehydrogenase-like 7 [Hibiscus syriacus]|uniref:Alcohol dehydrogenase-like 7 n=1 Tax=Hibiscus syriacus TaxID=106335 RepID=A0A6A3CPK3_HIBSY|nr:Alcohol dehydrogenase-like 7 [Hibiscus syriacus]